MFSSPHDCWVLSAGNPGYWPESLKFPGDSRKYRVIRFGVIESVFYPAIEIKFIRKGIDQACQHKGGIGIGKLVGVAFNANVRYASELFGQGNTGSDGGMPDVVFISPGVFVPDITKV